MKPHHWICVALAISAGFIGASGHDGWGWFLFVIVILN
jgi:hypothetical protein